MFKKVAALTIPTLFIILISSCGGSKELAIHSPTIKDSYFMAYNIWFENPERLYAINYKTGNIIPAGTKVDQVSIGKNRLDYIEFRVPEWDRVYRINIDSKFQTGLTVSDIFNRTFSGKDFNELTAGFTENEKNAVREARVVKGMSKAAVLLAYGYPPAHMTPDTSMNTWTYWRNRWAQFMVEFDENDKVLNDADWR